MTTHPTQTSPSLNDGDDLPRRDHIARYCRPRSVSTGSYTAASFEDSHPYRSVNWLEYFRKSSMVENISEMHRMFALTFKTKPNGAYAILHVEQSIAAAKKIRDILILYKPLLDREKYNPAHSGIFNCDHEVALRLAALLYENNVLYVSDI